MRIRTLILALSIAACGGSAATTTTAPVVTTSSVATTTSTPATVPSSTAASTTTTQPPPSYAVVLVEAGDVLNVRDAPMGNIITTFGPTATGIAGTGNTQSSGGDEWVEIAIPAGTGWVNGHFLTVEIAASVFAGDPEPPDLGDELGDMAGGTGGSWSNLVGPHGLSVVHFDPLKWWPPNTDPFADPTVYPWGGEAAGPAAFSATFSAQVGVSLDGVLNDPDLTVGVDTPMQGPEAAPPFIPLPFQNFHYLAAFDPADDPNNGGLDWLTWYVFFDWTPQGWRIAALSVDGWAP